MDAPDIVPSSEHWRIADEAVRDKITESCAILERIYLEGRPCKWHVTTQQSISTPYLLTALDPHSNESVQQFNLDKNGQIESKSSAGLSPTSPLPSPSPPQAISKALSDTLARHGMQLVRLDFSPQQSDSGTGTPSECLGVIVQEIRGNRETVEDDVRRAYLSALPAMYGMDTFEESTLPGRGTGSFKIRILQDEPRPAESSLALKPEPKLRLKTSAQSLTSSSRGSPSLQKKSSISSMRSYGGATPPRSPISRRVSSNLLATRTVSSPKGPAVNDTMLPQKTPASVAREYFERDMAQHAQSSTEPELVVILHDSCYGHRFSRPKTSKANLSTIVERPERILATVLGISVAYVLMGGRHTGAEYPPHPETKIGPLPFRIRKSNRFVPLGSPTVTNVHGTRWMAELRMMCESAEGKLISTGKELVRPTPLLNDESKEERPQLHEGDLYLCEESLNALEGALGGVLDAVDAIFDVSGPKRAFVGIRPPGHHCSADYPSGFCWLNNVHVGISHAAAVHGMTHAAIIDFDLHHGDGSQAIAWDHNAKVAALPRNAAHSKRTAIGYFSIHDINSYPCEWGDLEKVQNASLCIEQAHGQTIWNVHLQPWKTDAEFWELYENRYSVLLHKTRSFLKFHTERLNSSASAPQPRAAIFISAGFDASEWEGQGMQRHKVNVPTDFYSRFTKDIMDIANEPGLGVDGRMISVLEGGYSDRALTSGVLSHLSGMAHVVKTEEARGAGESSSHDVVAQLQSMSLAEQLNPPIANRERTYLGSQAWSPSALDELEAVINPPPPTAPRKPRGPVNPTYTTLTQSFTAKMHPSVRRSSAGITENVPSIPVPEIIPDVSWAAAAQELCKILTPNRQVHSCKAEDLNAQATKVRRDRQSLGGMDLDPSPLNEDGRGMQLRAKKSKAPTTDGDRPQSRSNRRTTIGGSELSNLLNSQGNDPPKAPRRRVSVASTILSTADDAKNTAATTQRTRRSSGASVARPSSAASKKADNGAEKSRKSRSPTKPRVQKKSTSDTPVPKLPSTYRQASSASDVVRAEGGLDAITSGVSKMKIKLNLPPKPDDDPSAPKSKIGRPRKTLAAPKSPKKPGPAAVRLVSAASTASSSGPPDLSHATITPVDGGAGGPLRSDSDHQLKINVELSPSTDAASNFQATMQRPTSSRASSKVGSRSGMQSPDSHDSSFEVKPFDAASASTFAKQQGASGAMSTMPPPTRDDEPTQASPTKPETPRAPRQLPKFTSTTPIPFSPFAVSPSKPVNLANGNTNGMHMQYSNDDQYTKEEDA